jgi:hypothetical protein
MGEVLRIVWSISTYPAWSDEDAQNFYICNLFIIRRRFHYLHLFREPVVPKPEIPC